MKKVFLGTVLPALLMIGYVRWQAAAWEMAIEAAHTTAGHGAELVLGAEPGADIGYDASDLPLPPAPPAGFVDLFTSHSRGDEGWEYQPLPDMRYMREFGDPLGARDRSIDFVAGTDTPGTVSLSWVPMTDPELETYSVILRDVVLGGAIDMKAQSIYNAFFFGPGERRFRVELIYLPPPDPTPTPVCEADYDLQEDGVINEGDLLLMATYMRHGGGGDLNCDDKTDALDLWILSRHWGAPAP